MKKRSRKMLVLLLSVAMVLSTMIAAVPAFAASGDTKTITTTATMKDTGNTSGMYAMDSVVVTEQEDGTYLVRMHQTKVNRNVLAVTDSVSDATSHVVDWHVGGGSDGYWFTMPLESLDSTITVCFSSTDRIADGNDFGNPVVISFAKSTLGDTTESPAVASDINTQASATADAATKVTLKNGNDVADKAIIAINGSVTLTAMVGPSNLKAEDKAVTWSSSDDAIASVSSGVVTGHKSGRATITAKTNNGTSASCEVSVCLNNATLDNLKITNNTGMFNVVSASVTTTDGKSVLKFALNSTGYEDIFIGTYEQANATTTGGTIDKSKWIHYTLNADGKYEFEVPLEAGQTFIPIQALSQNYVKKGQYRWYSRQIVLDFTASTATAGDYDCEETLALTNNISVLPTESAALETIGGPVSNNYQEVLNLTMKDTSFDKAYVGTAADAKAASTARAVGDVIALDENKSFAIGVKANKTGGEVDYDYLDKPVTVSFHSAADDTWTEVEVVVSKTNKTVAINEAGTAPNPNPGQTTPGGTNGGNNNSANTNTTTPKTGDDNSLMAWALIMALGAVSVAGIKSRKNNL